MWLGNRVEIGKHAWLNLGMEVPLAPDHEHGYMSENRARRSSGWPAICFTSSDFVMKTFFNKGYSGEKLARHTYEFV